MPDEQRTGEFPVGEGTPEERLATLEAAYKSMAARFGEFEKTIYRFGKRMIVAIAIAVIACCGALFANYRTTGRVDADQRKNDEATCVRGNEFRDLTRSSLEGTLKALIPDPREQARALAAAAPELKKISDSKRNCDVEPRKVSTTSAAP